MFMPAPYDDYKVILLMHRSISRDPVDDPKKPIREEEETALEAYGAAGVTAAITKLGDLLRPQLDVSETGKEHD